MAVSCFGGCQLGSTPLPEWVDYVGQLKLDMDSPTAKAVVDLKLNIDGDTTHFYVPKSISEDGILKARYIAVNTPESTGQIEEWGKKASNFTREKLTNAESIVIESNTETWEKDSSGGRHMAWVWYKPKGEAEYRNLNLELVQNGLSLTCGASSDRYGDLTQLAYTQAQLYKLNCFSGEKDPDFYYGGQISVDLKTLRTNTALFDGMTVAFTGIIARITSPNGSTTVYVESYDEETDMYYGMSVYAGYSGGAIDKILKVGNEVRFVGKVQYYEGGKTWQVSDIRYSAFDEEDPDNLKLISTGHKASNRVTDAATFNDATLTLDVPTSIGGADTESKTFKYAELAMNTSIVMKDLHVVDVATTQDGNNAGAMTLTCTVNGETISVRTNKLWKPDKTLYTEADFLNQTITVTGIVDYFNHEYHGGYQIKVFSVKDIVFQ